MTIVHDFGDGSVPSDGRYPTAALIQGTDGTLYGTTEFGGAAATSFDNGGTVFAITTTGAVTILHSFSALSSTYTNSDGAEPNGLIRSPDGDFYGTAYDGGSSGSGTVFKITPSGTLTVLHDFSDGSVPNDGSLPEAALVLGRDGNFYGTTYGGGSGNLGTVFKITPSGTETVLHSFGTGNISNDGANPTSSLVQGADGNFYGTTSQDSSSQMGTVFKITPSGKITILHSFGDGSVLNDGASPNGLILGTDGSFYGTTQMGGAAATPDEPGYGTVFKITTSGVETVLHRFDDGTVLSDGVEPRASLVQGSDGSFYGTTKSGGDRTARSRGTIFKMTANGKETILHRFGDGTTPHDGQYPTTALTQGSDGNFYGGTQAGGTSPYGGTVYALNPAAFVPAPVITAFSPASGPAGSFVRITGQNLLGVNAVRFHDANATYVLSGGFGTQMTVGVPAGAMKGTITVTTFGGSVTTMTPFRVTYRPVITSFTPTSGPVGTVVTITGTHLTGITRVRFHEADAAVYSSNADGTQLTVTIPPGAATGTITLDNRDRLATTSTGVFTVTPRRANDAEHAAG